LATPQLVPKGSLASFNRSSVADLSPSDRLTNAAQQSVCTRMISDSSLCETYSASAKPLYTNSLRYPLLKRHISNTAQAWNSRLAEITFERPSLPNGRFILVGF